MARIASKLLAIIFFALLAAPMMIGLDQRAAARLNKMSAEQLMDHERHVLGHGLVYHFVLCAVGVTLAVAFVDGISWCIRAPFQHWARKAHSISRRTPPPLPAHSET